MKSLNLNAAVVFFAWNPGGETEQTKKNPQKLSFPESFAVDQWKCSVESDSMLKRALHDLCHKTVKPETWKQLLEMGKNHFHLYCLMYVLQQLKHYIVLIICIVFEFDRC